MARNTRAGNEGYNDALPEKIRELKEKNRVSQKTLAEVLGTTPQNISLYENGQSKPSWQAIIKLAKFFNVSTDYILGLPAPELNDPELAVAIKYTGLSEDAVKVLNFYASEELPRAILNDYPTVISMLLTSRIFEEILRLLASASGWKKKEEREGFSPNEEGDLPAEYSVEDLKKAHEIVSAVGNTWLSYGEAAEYNTQKAAFLFQKLARQLAGIDPIEPNSDITQTKSFMRYFAEGGAENGSHTED